MRILYIHGADIPVDGFADGFIGMMNAMLASLAKHSHVDRVICTLDPSPEELARRIACPWPTEFIKPLRWKEGLCYPDIRIPTLQSALISLAKEGDEILLLEADMLCVGDPFDAFGLEFNIGIPQRRSWNCRVPVNIGLTAIRWTELSRQFLSFWAAEVVEPTQDFVLKYHNGNTRRTVEEDVPNAAFAAMNTKQITMLPSEYNWFPDECVLLDRAAAATEYREKFFSPGNCKVLHFKGDNKHVMAELSEETP